MLKIDSKVKAWPPFMNTPWFYIFIPSTHAWTGNQGNFKRLRKEENIQCAKDLLVIPFALAVESTSSAFYIRNETTKQTISF